MRKQRRISPSGASNNSYLRPELQLPTVVTLGPSGTCSEAVVLKSVGIWFPIANVVLANTYEEGGRLVANRAADLLVVAAAYPQLNDLVFGAPRRLTIVGAFRADTPAIVIASRSATEPITSLAAMPAPAPLARERYPTAKLITALSNAAAADTVVEGGTVACVTTEVAALQRGLCVRYSFGVESMAWVIFGRKS